MLDWRRGSVAGLRAKCGIDKGGVAETMVIQGARQGS
jgi:hypothetical protein